MNSTKKARIEFQCDLCLCNLVLSADEVGKRGKGIKCSRCGHLHGRQRASEICGEDFEGESDLRSARRFRRDSRRDVPRKRPSREEIHQSRQSEEEDEVLPVYVSRKRANEGGFVFALSLVGLFLFFIPVVSLVALIMGIRQWVGILNEEVSPRRIAALNFGMVFSLLGIALGTWYLGSLLARPTQNESGSATDTVFSTDWWIPDDTNQ